MTTWSGMSAHTGKAITDIDHITQSIRDIITTPIGSRVMRRAYGSELIDLIDQPQNGATRLRMMAAIVHALTLWEPRIRITAINIGEPSMDGKNTITITWQRADGTGSETIGIQGVLP